MGVKGMWELVQDAAETTSLRTLTLREGFEGARPERLYYIGVDVSIWMQTMLHQFSTGHAQSGENPEMRSLFYRLAMLAERPVHAIFVADGPQRPTYKRGKQVKAAPIWLTNGLRRLVEAFGFAWLEAAGEAEAELAKMNSLGLIDAVMTNDSDTLIFGASVIIHNPSFKRNGSDEVTVYRKSKIMDKLHLSPDDLLIFALLVGCDYDQAGLRNCGPGVAKGLARYGFGRALRLALDAYNDNELAVYLIGWRDQVRARLRGDPFGLIGRKFPKLAANVPNSFPNVKAARYLAAPALLSDAAYEPVLQPRPIDFAELARTCETYFSWGNVAELVNTFRTTLWPDELTRMLVSEGLHRKRIMSKVGRPRSLLKLSLMGVGETPAYGYAMCKVKVSDTGLGDVVRLALYGVRPYPSTAKKSEEDVLRKSQEALVIRVPALVLERARPWLLTPSYEKDGYSYGRPDRSRILREPSMPSPQSAGLLSSSPSGNISSSSQPAAVPLDTTLCRSSSCTAASSPSTIAATSPLTTATYSLTAASSPPTITSSLHAVAAPLDTPSRQSTSRTAASSLQLGASAPPTVASSPHAIASSPHAVAAPLITPSRQSTTRKAASSLQLGASAPLTVASFPHAIASSPHAVAAQLDTSTLPTITSSLHPEAALLGTTLCRSSSCTPVSSPHATTGPSLTPTSFTPTAMSSIHASRRHPLVPDCLDEVIDCTLPTPRPRRARKLKIIDLTGDDVIDLTED